MLKSYLPYILKYSLSAVDIARFASRLLLTQRYFMPAWVPSKVPTTFYPQKTVCIIRLVNDSFEFCPSYASHA